jgi:hypothetical protein
LFISGDAGIPAIGGRNYSSLAAGYGRSAAAGGCRDARPVLAALEQVDDGSVAQMRGGVTHGCMFIYMWRLQLKPARDRSLPNTGNLRGNSAFDILKEYIILFIILIT